MVQGANLALTILSSKRLPMKLPVYLSLFAALLSSFNAVAVPVNVMNIVVDEYVTGNIVTNLNPGAATDGNLSTAFTAGTTRNPVFPTQGLGGFEIRWDFDVSNFTTLDSFTLNFTGRLHDPSSIDSIAFRPIGAMDAVLNPNTYTLVSMPDDVTVSSVIELFSGAPLARNEIGNYVSGGILSIYTSTTFGFSSPQSISMDVFEVSADVTGTSINVPTPGSLLLLLAGLVGLVTAKSLRI